MGAVSQGSGYIHRRKWCAKGREKPNLTIYNKLKDDLKNEGKYRKSVKKENVRQNLSSLRQEIKDENALAEALKLLAGEDELLVSFMGADDAKTRKNAALLIGDLHMSQLSDEVFISIRGRTDALCKGFISGGAVTAGLQRALCHSLWSVQKSLSI